MRSEARSEISETVGGIAAKLCGPSDCANLRAAANAEIRWGKDLFEAEDLLHTGAHKINNCLGQALLVERMGKAPG